MILNGVYGILPDYEEIKGILKEYAEDGCSVEDDQDLNYIRRTANRVETLSRFSSNDLPIVSCRMIFNYYLLEIFPSNERKVFADKKDMYDYLRDLSEQESNQVYNYNSKIGEAFDELDYIYESL